MYFVALVFLVGTGFKIHVSPSSSLLRAIVVVVVVDRRSRITRPLLTKPPPSPALISDGGAAAVAGDLAVVGGVLNVVVVVGVGAVGVVVGVGAVGVVVVEVAQRPAAREAGTLRCPEARHAGGWDVRCCLWLCLWWWWRGAGRQGR